MKNDERENRTKLSIFTFRKTFFFLILKFFIKNLKKKERKLNRKCFKQPTSSLSECRLFKVLINT